MSVAREIRYSLSARLCPNCTSAEIHSVCTEADMFAIRATGEDILGNINKVTSSYAKFNATPSYLTHNWKLFFVPESSDAPNQTKPDPNRIGFGFGLDRKFLGLGLGKPEKKPQPKLNPNKN
jgi:hypothetical protein